MAHAAQTPFALHDIRGTYDAPARPGGPPGQARPNWRMLGAIVEAPKGPLFVKLVGPAAEVNKHAAAFDGWLNSLRTSR